MRRLICAFALRERDFTRTGHLSQSACHELLSEARRSLTQTIDDKGKFILRYGELEHVAEVGPTHESIEVMVQVIEIGTSSATLAQELRTGSGEIAAHGRFVIVAWDDLRHRKRSLTASEIELLRADDGDGS